MVGERIADRRTGHGRGTFWSQGRVQPKLAIITVTGCHLIPVISVGVIGNLSAALEY